VNVVRALFLFVSVVLACVASGASAAVKNGSIAIEKAAPARLQHDFKLGEQPEHLTYQLKDEAGLCVYQFGLQILVETEYPRLAFKNVTATIKGVKMRLTLETTLWVSKEGGARVQAHEEAHRAICELFYRDADQIATGFAQTLLGQKVTVPNKDRENGFRAELEKLQQRVLADYEKAVNERCAFAQKRFDEITDHGRADIPNAEAVEKALAEERARAR
jgi:hypothetical protein